MQTTENKTLKRTTISISTDIILLDIRGYSKKDNKGQLEIVEIFTKRIKALINLLRNMGSINVPLLENNPIVMGYVPTGDGAYILLNPLFAGYGILLAHAIRSNLLMFNKKYNNSIFEGIRGSVHLGTFFVYQDITNRINFAGDGLNDCARISNAHKEKDFPNLFTDEDYLIASSDAIDCFEDRFISKAEPEYLKLLEYKKSNLLKIEDKHKKTHTAHLVEMKRHFTIQPFNPAKTLDEKSLAINRAIANGTLQFPINDL